MDRSGAIWLRVAAGGGRRRVARLERVENIRKPTIAAIVAALEAAGVQFIPENGGGAGVRLRGQGMTSMNERQTYIEVAEILQTILRNIAMKRALSADNQISNHLNFFRVYDNCLFDVTVVAWCKVFGSRRESTHWRKVFQGDLSNLEPKIWAAGGGEEKYEQLSREIRAYRDKIVAHYDEKDRPEHHPYLDPLRDTAIVVYTHVYSALDPYRGTFKGIPNPDKITGANLARLERHWTEIARTARQSVEHFRE